VTSRLKVLRRNSWTFKPAQAELKLREDEEKRILVGTFIETSIRRISEARSLDGTDLCKEPEDEEVVESDRSDEKSDCDGIKPVMLSANRQA
jgi:hypothetical protein